MGLSAYWSFWSEIITLCFSMLRIAVHICTNVEPERIFSPRIGLLLDGPRMPLIQGM